MLILSLDTTTAAGSAAVLRDSHVLVERAGAPGRMHGERLPTELMQVLEAAEVPLKEIDLYAVASGPGSFTGLRVGIATIQGLALAHGRRVAAVSALEALAWCVRDRGNPIAVWMDARRGEVFAAGFGADGRTSIVPPSALTPEAALERWLDQDVDRLTFVGDGAVLHGDTILNVLGERASIIDRTPMLAGAIGEIAALTPERAVAPHAIVPLYVRRPDAVLARERRGR